MKPTKEQIQKYNSAFNNLSSEIQKFAHAARESGQLIKSINYTVSKSSGENFGCSRLSVKVFKS